MSKKLCSAMGVSSWKSYIGEPRNVINSNDYIYRPQLRNKYGGYKHMTAEELKGYTGEEKWNDYFTFSFVRNPWSRTLSTYLKYRKSNNRVLQLIWPKGKTLFNLALVAKYKILDRPSVQQVDFIASENCARLDFVGRYETLERDFKQICSKIGRSADLDETHDSTINNKRRRHYRDYYNSTTKKIVRAKNKKDIRTFGYTF